MSLNCEIDSFFSIQKNDQVYANDARLSCLFFCQNRNKNFNNFKFECLLREHLVKIYEETGERLVDLGSDQTSLHNPFNGGYYPVQVCKQFDYFLVDFVHIFPLSIKTDSSFTKLLWAYLSLFLAGEKL